MARGPMPGSNRHRSGLCRPPGLRSLALLIVLSPAKRLDFTEADPALPAITELDTARSVTYGELFSLVDAASRSLRPGTTLALRAPNSIDFAVALLAAPTGAAPPLLPASPDAPPDALPPLLSTPKKSSATAIAFIRARSDSACCRCAAASFVGRVHVVERVLWST